MVSQVGNCGVFKAENIIADCLALLGFSVWWPHGSTTLAGWKYFWRWLWNRFAEPAQKRLRLRERSQGRVRGFRLFLQYSFYALFDPFQRHWCVQLTKFSLYEQCPIENWDAITKSYPPLFQVDMICCMTPAGSSRSKPSPHLYPKFLNEGNIQNSGKPGESYSTCLDQRLCNCPGYWEGKKESLPDFSSTFCLLDVCIRIWIGRSEKRSCDRKRTYPSGFVTGRKWKL